MNKITSLRDIDKINAENIEYIYLEDDESTKIFEKIIKYKNLKKLALTYCMGNVDYDELFSILTLNFVSFYCGTRPYFIYDGDKQSLLLDHESPFLKNIGYIDNFKKSYTKLIITIIKNYYIDLNFFFNNLPAELKQITIKTHHENINDKFIANFCNLPINLKNIKFDISVHPGYDKLNRQNVIDTIMTIKKSCGCVGKINFIKKVKYKKNVKEYVF